MDVAMHDRYMQQAVTLARVRERGLRLPYVGAVLVAPDGSVLSRGRKRFIEGTSLLVHAERDAIDKVPESVAGATLYTTLEPCYEARLRSHHNHIFHSCAELIVESGIRCVIVGRWDDVMMNGRGIGYLRNHRVKVIHYLDAIPPKRRPRHEALLRNATDSGSPSYLPLASDEAFLS